MKARIYKPARTAMQQSGQADGNPWVLEFIAEKPLFIDPLMGWTGMKDMTQEIQLSFPSQQEAEDYARHNGIAFEAKASEARVIKPKSYAANFAFNRAPEPSDTSQ
jgi:hypothetical protein